MSSHVEGGIMDGKGGKGELYKLYTMIYVIIQSRYTII